MPVVLLRAADLGLELAGAGPATTVRRSTVVRTARKLFDGVTWPRPTDTTPTPTPTHGRTTA